MDMPDKIKVLITAFGPYDRVPINISESTLNAFKLSDFFKNLPKDVEIVTEVLAVDTKQLQSYGDLIKKHNPTYVIALGAGADNEATKIRYEAASFNRYADVDAKPPVRETIEDNSPAVHFGVSSKFVFDLLSKNDPSLVYSYHAGDYGMCNATYYELTHEMEKASKPNRTMFLHLAAPCKSGRPEAFDAIGYQGEFQTYAESYAESLEKIVTTMNAIHRSSEGVTKLAVKDEHFSETFIPEKETGAKKTFQVFTEGVTSQR